MRQLLAVLSFAGMFSVLPFVHADESQHDTVLTAKVEALIEKLALTDSPDRLSRDEEEARHQQMIRAWIELRDLGPEAFPKIAAHLQDKRTSFTEDSGSTDETWTVGRACFDVLRCNLEPYNWGMYSSSIPPEKYWWRPQYCQQFLNTSEKAKDWLSRRQSKSLVDLQIEVLQWVSSNRSDRKVEISQEDWKSLREKLDSLKRTRKPLEPAVPWSK